MIVTELEIENYKQFAHCRLQLPRQGIIGIIGANGAGKTTLFEAIEWCLYNPREISNDEVPPHGGVGQTRVCVTLEDPVDGSQYVIERKLKRKTVHAEIYQPDDGQPIVQGSRQVSEYVARQLIGLGHRAFVSTFFTRQKELSFFGSYKDTDRRREVARLLGLETIRLAQQSVGDERKTAKAEAEAWRLHYEQEMAGRDFPQEIAEAGVAIERCQKTVGETDAALNSASDAVKAARQQLDQQHDLERRDHQIELQMQDIDGKRQAAEQSRAFAAGELARLDRAACQREELQPVADAVAELQKATLRHEAEHERFIRRQHLEHDLTAATHDQQQAIDGLATAVQAVPADPSLPDWRWTADDAEHPLIAADRLITVVLDLDVDGANAWAETLRDLTRQLAERDQYRTSLDRLNQNYRNLEEQREKLLAAGEPELEAQHAREEREAALKVAQTAETMAEQAATLAAPLRRLAASLREHRFDDTCPTCGRPFDPAQMEADVAALDASVTKHGQDEQTQRKQAKAARADAKKWAAAEQAASERAENIRNLTARLEAGLAMIEKAKHELADSAAVCAEAMRQAGLSQEPTPDMVRAARDEATRLQRMTRALSGLRQLAASIGQSQERAREAEQELSELGPVTYDQPQHEAAVAAQRRAEEAVTRISEIDQQLARRPEFATRRETADAELTKLAKARQKLDEERTAIGFNPGMLETATQRETDANQAEREAMTACENARAALKEATDHHDQLVRDEQRLRELAARADARAATADQLDRMYKEFTLFDQYVANRVAPRLADDTGALLGEVTDGKYDRVEFDQDYGLRIFDGDHESFPLAEFSGGERDVAALCARIALSRLIGARANHPPSFLVLDEVFGSLDRDRRTLTLDTIGTLTGAADAFRQVFIISHVDDVRFSPIFDTVWRIVETDEGISEIEQVADGLAIDEV